MIRNMYGSMIHDVIFNPSDGQNFTQRPPTGSPPVDRRYRDPVNLGDLRPGAAFSTGRRIDNRRDPA